MVLTPVVLYVGFGEEADPGLREPAGVVVGEPARL
jgi:hypothetical protein